MLNQTSIRSHKSRIILLLKLFIPYLYIAYGIYVWPDCTSCYQKLFIMNFIILHVVVFIPNIYKNFDILIVIAFLLWIIENDNQNDPSCLDTNDGYFLIMSFILFKFALWILTSVVIIAIIAIFYILAKDSSLSHNQTESGFYHQGLNDDEIKQLPSFQYEKPLLKNENSKETNEVCAICLSEFEQNEFMIKLPHCEHIFHSGCVKNWISRNSICPYCRGKVIESSKAPQKTPDRDFENSIEILDHKPQDARNQNGLD